MGTHVDRAISVKRLAEDKASSYGMQGYSFDGMDFFNCYAGFSFLFEEVKKTSRPVLVEVLTERFKGHSVSDPGLYRSKEKLKSCMQRDPLILLEETLIQLGWIDQEQIKQMDKKEKELVLEAMQFADQAPWPDPNTLEEDVFAP